MKNELWVPLKTYHRGKRICSEIFQPAEDVMNDKGISLKSRGPVLRRAREQKQFFICILEIELWNHYKDMFTTKGSVILMQSTVGHCEKKWSRARKL